MDVLYKIIHDPNKDIFQKFDEQVDTFWQCSKTIKHVFEVAISTFLSNIASIQHEAEEIILKYY